MNLQGILLVSYEVTLRFLRRLGLPLTLLLCYFSAIGLRFLAVVSPFSRVEMELVHRSFGLLLCSLLVALLYDRFQAKKRRKVSLSKAKARLAKLSSNGPKDWVDVLFYGFLGVIVLLGLVLHFKTRLAITGWIGLEWIYGLHSTLVWFFLSLILVKYYLTISGWLASFWAYLKEH